MSRIRLIGFDLDGTLLDPDKSVSLYTIGIFRRCAKEQILLVPVTGRPFHGIPESVRSIPYLTHLISSNGAVTTDLKTGQVLRRKAMPLCLVQKILRRVSSYRIIKEVFVGGYGYHDAETDLLWKKRNLIPAQQIYLKESRRKVADLPEFLERAAAFFAASEPESAAGKPDGYPVTEEELAEDIYLSADSETDQKDILAGMQDLKKECRIVESFTTDLEFGAPHADKGEAFLDLAAHYGIDRTETAAFGDGGNDFGLLEAAGTAVAMGNAIPEIKQMADFVTEDNRHDGVAKGIRRLLW